MNTKEKRNIGLIVLFALLILLVVWQVDVRSEPIGRVYIPLLVHGQPYNPVLTIYDLDHEEQDWPWLIETFGDVVLDRGTGGASVARLWAVEGPVALVTWVMDKDDNPVAGAEVVYHWQGAPLLEPGQMACGLTRGLVLKTTDRGNADFPMGRGSYYFPPAGGPHTVWVVAAGTDCLRGLGMLGFTNHIHIDSKWVLP